jgi:hypothetical protein
MRKKHLSWSNGSKIASNLAKLSLKSLPSQCFRWYKSTIQAKIAFCCDFASVKTCLDVEAGFLTSFS